MAAVASPELVGRFELLRVLGRGSQSTVWLARDSRLGRQVALKRFAGGDAPAGAGLGDWLSEARAVAALNHPHIVPVFEADVHGGGAQAEPYLVFEYIAGATLDAHLKQHGPYAAREAVERLMGVCEALAQAHAAGLVHRDLKPSNLLIDAAGHLRVTDFGIAVRSGAAALAAGSPRYVAPETLRGEAPTPRVDVFALGLLLAELLLGRALIEETQLPAILQRIAQTDLALPAQTPQPVDDGLRGVIQRALARRPATRYADAGELAAALRRWLSPSLDEAQPDEGGAALPVGTPKGDSAALDFLLRRMRHKGDFPALSDSVAGIQRIAAAENENIAALAQEILRDVALTQKLLRLVNTAHYKRMGGGVSTVSRAIALMGFAGVRNLALSLVLVEHMNDKAHAQQIKQEFMRALLAGTLAEELCPGALARHGGLEEAFLGAMFQNLGRLLCEFYFPDEAEQVRRLVHPGAGTARSTPRAPVTEAAASLSVLGVSYEELGLGVARHWGLPDNLQRCMRAASGTPPAQPPVAAPDRMRWLAIAANDVADRLLHHEPGEAQRQIAQAATRHARALGLSERDMVAAVGRSRERLAELARGLAIRLPTGSPAERLLAPRAHAAPLSAAAATAPCVSTAESAESAESADWSAATLELAASPDGDRTAAADPAAVLAAGIQDITNSMVEEVALGELLRMILEAMYRALGFRRVLFCLRDTKTGELVGRFMLGDRPGPCDDAVRSAFRIPTQPRPGAAPDLLCAVCIKGTDLLVADTAANDLRSRLPVWYRDKVDAPTFLLLPLLAKGAPVGLIYADKAHAGSIVLGEKELSLLRTLRNQAVMAFRQAGGA